LRIIGGAHKRRLLKVPSGLPVRPTTDMAKEALFNVLNNHFDFEAIRVIDLFSGTGNIAIEFASRGSLEVVAVEKHPRCIDFIRKVIQELSLDNLRIVRADAFRFLGFCKGGFDIIFADPPYDMESIERIPGMVFEKNLLAPRGWLIVEHSAASRFRNHPNLIEERKYGKVNFSFFAHKNNG